MIQFLNPSILWALWLMAIPLIIHLINLHRHKVIYFSQTSFLKKVEKESRRTRKLNNLILLILRMLAIGFLVLAFAQPKIVDEDEAGQVPSSAVVIFIDNSLSMQAENRNGNLLEQAKQYAIQRISTFPETTPVKVLSHNGLVADKINPKLVQGVMKSISYSATAVSSQSLLQLLSLTENIGQSQIWLISDMQENYWRTFFEMADTSLYLIPVQIDSDEPENVVVDTVWFDSPYRNAGIEQNLRVRITNRGKKFRSNIPLRLYLNDTLTSVQSIDLEVNETKNLSFVFSLSNLGWIQGRVEIDDYPIVFDNAYFFTYYVHPKRHVLLVGDEDYFASLTRLYTVSEHIQPHVIQPGYINPGMIDSASCVIVRNPEKLSAGISELLFQKVGAGSNLVLLLNETTSLETENRFLQQYSISPLGKTAKSDATVNDINLRHYIFNRSVLSIDKDTKMPRVESIRRFQNPFPQSNVLMATDLKDAVVVAKNQGKGTVFVATTEMVKNPEFSKHPIFVPLFINMVQFSGGALEPIYTLDNNLCFDVAVGEWNANDLPKLTLPLENIEIIPRFQTSNLNLRVCLHNQANHSGIWILNSGNRHVANIALNHNRKESIPEYLSEDNQVKGLRNFSKTDKPFERGHEDSFFAFWQLLVALALACFVAELFLLRKGTN
jgi:hypothetical protein